MRISWRVADNPVPTPGRSVVDGSMPAERVTITAHAVADPLRVHRLILPLGPADADRFRRFARLVVLQRIAGFAVLALWLAMLLASVALRLVELQAAFTIFTVAVLANMALALVTVALRPRQYPVRTGNFLGPPRLRIRDVHPQTAAEWQTIAGPRVRVEP
ncbi:hypothetical protein KZZ52_29125 [Dactylosporangium sp. AC04546]|uniref:hypothetical protein n=1 Tax=Dactylosporangium sp. AC04546 TaxID=2862460 RepID=UPI001EDD3E99|nr:hypothetical protein [Dactylosporangium sp. AC04546]WVK89330.1 hypothetical protein KZZ52_29125 [Dactylosporangium sp. AC04546]